MESKKCLHCGKEFTGNKKKIYCGDNCRKLAHDKKQTSIVQTVKENKPITKEFLQMKFPDVPEHLLRKAKKISDMETVLNENTFKESVVKGITNVYNRRKEIFDIKMLQYRLSQDKELRTEMYENDKDCFEKMKKRLDELEEKELIFNAKWKVVNDNINADRKERERLKEQKT